MTTLTVKKLGKANVLIDIVKKGNAAVRPGYQMAPTFITIHNTGNPAKTANAKAHRTLLHRNASLATATWASYHFVVDDKEIYQLLPLNESGWHTGDGSGIKSGNRTSIGIEICENVDMDYKQAEENAIELIKHLMALYKIPLKNVVPHQHWSGKYCPHIILDSKGGFPNFLKRIESKTVVATNPSPTQTAPTAPTKYTIQKGETFTSIAKKYAGLTATDIQNANPSVDAKKLQIGQVIIIPTKAATTYKIANGDTFTSIAKKFTGVTLKMIQDANPKVDAKKLQIGQEIIIPEGK